jgi:hypothetical protein
VGASFGGVACVAIDAAVAEPFGALEAPGLASLPPPERATSAITRITATNAAAAIARMITKRRFVTGAAGDAATDGVIGAGAGGGATGLVAAVGSIAGVGAT